MRGPGRRAWGAALGLVAMAAVAFGAAGCGPSGDPAARAGATVLAAASLTEAFRAIDPRADFGFAGSDRLAFQIEQGAPADIFASASPTYTRRLHERGLVLAPRVFATNRLVVIVPRGDPAIRGVGDLARTGVKLVIGGPGVPIGAYTRAALSRLGLDAALENVVSEEQDVKAIVAKVALGEADAGIAYLTDVRPARERVRAIALPPGAEPAIRYEVAVVRAAPHPAEARAFVDRLLGPQGRGVLAELGFGLPGAR